MEIGIVKQVDIQEEMQGAYLDYAMSVIVARALPDVRDGLKPVHRRILYAMHDMGLTFEKPYKKSARIVGEVLGKYHPHGDVAVYDAMVRMAQDFSLRYTLVDGQGNFGSIDGDNPAAMRYTEARLRDLAAQMLSDIDKDTIDFVPNFDETLQEPSVLPAALPNLLVNGASGIAVGMATNIPPHNLVEVCDALAYLIDRYDKVDEITVEELMRFIKGPDFPTGGMIYRYESDSRTDGDDVIARAYASGRGRFRVQARIHIEEMSRSRNRIVVTELPYQVNKTRLIERIAELARDEKIEGITDLRDESDRSGMRIVIETTRTVDPKKVLADLYKYTPMQQTFGMSMLALVNGEPRHLGLRRVLQLHVEHRREIIRRRSEYELRQAKERAHILEGLLRALDILDEVIQAIRRSRTTATARANLIREFKFTEAQAQAILDMPLKRLAALERRRLQDEYEELLTRITYLEDLLAHPKKILDVIKEELADLREQYGDARRTRIIEAGVTQQSLTVRDMIADEPVLLALAPNGMVLRESMADRRRGKLPSKVDGQAPMAIAAGSTHDEIFFFAADGRMGRLAVHRLPEAGDVHPADRGVFNRNDRLVTVLVLGRLLDEEDNGRYLVLATREGRVKRIALRDAWNAIGVTTAMKVEDGDELIGAEVSDGSAEIILVTKLGQAIRFQESEVRPMGLPAAGVWGMKLSRGDEVVALCLTRPDGELVIATTAGYFKRTALRHYSEQRRHGSGLSAIRLGQRSGAVADARIALPGDEFFSASRTGTLRRLDLHDIPAAGRTATGRLIIQPAKNDIIVDLLHLPTTRTRSTPATANGSKTPPENRPQPRRQQPTGSGESKKNDETASPRSIRSRGRRSRSRSSTADGAGPDSSKPAAASPTRSSEGARATPKPSTSRRSKASAGSSGKAPARKSSPDKEPKDAAPTAKGAEKASQKTKPQASQLSLLDKLRSVQKP